ncbi:Ig-like domain-containing protein [Limnobaculum xujianqingii]|uniref:Ig-like domain-containing protein n=1 Tax=Limnobaculum xujianqingii TaxID=2738837 RepID=UPI0015BEDEEE|nr:Ig-like domain-containing protein [Limnobaculum xujianqingii]
MNTNASLLVNTGSGPSQVVSLNSGKPIKIKIQPGNKYLLKNQDDNYAPENVTLQRNGDDLYVILEGDSAPAIVIEDYYVSGDNTPLLGMAEDGQVYAYVITDGSGLGDGYLFNDGSFAPAALGGMPMGDGTYLFENTESNDFGLLALWPWFLGAAVIGGIVGNAIYEHNKDDGSSPAPTPASVPTLSGATDATGDITGPISYGSSTDETKPTLFGTGDAGNTITIYDNGKAIGSAVVGADGNWSFTPETALSEGSHKITITQTNPEGQTSSESDDFTFIVDTVAPNKPMFEALDDVGAIQGPIANGATTDDARPEFTGKGEAGSTITIYIDGKEAGKTTIGSDGTWSWTPTEDLADGHYQVTVTETDTAGNTSATSPTFDFNVDTTAPDKPPRMEAYDDVGDKTGLIENGDITDDAQPELKGWGEAGNTVIIYDNGNEIGRATIGDDGTWSFTPETALSEGSHSITYTQTDKAGNVSEPSDSRDFTVDTSGVNAPDSITIMDNTGDITGPIKSGDKTDETTPEFSGKGTPGGIITIYDNDEPIGSVVIDEDGTWSLIPDVALEEGSHSITTTETSKSGNESEPSAPIDFVVDTTPPAKPEIGGVIDNTGDKTGPITSGEPTDEKQPEFSGEGEPGSTIVIKDKDGEIIGSSIVDEDGNWTVKPEQPLEEGSNELVIVEIDEAGNESDPSDPFEVVVDTTPPAKPEIGGVTDNTGDKTGPITSGEPTDEKQPEFSGEGEPGSTIVIKDKDGEIIGSSIVDEDGNWTVKPEQPLEEGSNELVIVEIDEAGNESDPSDPFEVVVDTTPPAKPEIGGVIDNTGDKTGPITSGEPTDEKQPEFSGEGEPGSTIVIKDKDGEIIGSSIVDEDGNWTVKPEQPLEEGSNELVIVEIDEAGNESDPSDPFEVVVDTTPPAKPEIGGVIDNTGDKTGPITSGEPTDEKQPEFNGEGEPGSTIVIKDKDGEIIGSSIVDEDGNWTVKPDQPLEEGSNELVIVEIDTAGNESDPSDVFDVVVDTIAPEKPTIGGVTDNTGSITGPINSGDVTDETRPEFNGKGEPGSTITIKDAETGEVLGTATVDEDGNWTVQPETDLGEGNHSLVVTETDKAGNESEPSDPIEFEVDTTAPAKPELGGVYDNEGDITGMIKPGDETDDKTPTFTGEGEPGNTITVKDGDKVIGTAIVDENGAWTYTPETELGDGPHSITVTETDKAGNESDPSDSFDFVVDTTPPDAKDLSITGVMDNYGEITGNITNGGATDDSRPVISGTGTAGDTIILYVNDGTGNHEIGRGTVGSDGKWSIQPEAPLLPGSNQFTAVEMDTAGNKTDPSNQYTVTLDVSRPSEPVIVNVLDNAGDIVGPLQKGDVTDDNQPTITGTAEAGYTIRIYDGATLLGTATADSKGVWTFIPDTVLADGKHNITATATSPVGQTSDKTGIFNFEVDTKAPDAVENLVVSDNVGDYQDPLKDGDTTDDNTPTFSGKAEAGSTVTIYADGKVLGTAKVDGEGKWTFTPDSKLEDGTYNFTTTVTDKAGNINPDGPGLSLTVDTSTDPVSITALIDDVGTVTGNITANGVTDDTKPEITGEGKPGATIKVYDGTTLLGETTVKANGSWSFTPSTELKEGAHSITVTMTDKAGNLTGPTAAFDFTVDTTAPTVPTIEFADDDVGSKQGLLTSGSMTDDSTPTLKGTAEKGSLVTIYDNGQFLGTATADETTGEWSFTPSTPISEGEHKFHVTATDAAGNVSDPSTDFLLTTDYTGPDAANLKITGVADNYGEITGNIENGKATDDSRPTIQGTGTAGDTIIVYAEDATGKHEIGSTTVGSDGKWSLQPEAPLLPGENKFTAVEIDPVGNFTDPSAEYVITLDMSRPTEPVIVNVLDNEGSVTGPLQKGDVTDDTKPVITGTSEAGYLVRIYDGATLIGSTTADSKGVWTFTPDTALADGKHNITATATSPLGQTSNPTGIFNFEVDTKAPDSVENLQVFDNVGDKQGYILDGDTTDDATPTFSGKAEPGSTVTIYDNGNAIGTAKVDSEGNWSYTPDSNLPDGEHIFTTSVTDKAGNINTDGPSLTITIDTSGVEVSISALVDNVGDITGNITPNGVTDDTKPEITGEGKAGSTITIYDGSTKLGETTVKADGTWSFTPETALKEGSHSITVIAQDKAGNTSDRSSAFEFTVDTTAPTVPTIEFADDDVGSKQGLLTSGSMTDDSTPTLKGTAEKGSLVTIYDNGQFLGTATADETTGEWSFTPSTPISEGEHKFHVTATDAAGNVSDPSTDFLLTTDYTGPDAANLKITGVEDNYGLVTGNIENGKATDDSRPTIHGTGTAGDTIIVYAEDATGKHEIGSTTVGADGKWSLEPTAPLLPGENKFTAVEIDPVGNFTDPSAEYVITLDMSRPTEPVIVNILDNEGSVTGPLQKGDVTDDTKPVITGTSEAGYLVRIYDNGKEIGSVTANDKGVWTFEPSTALAEGKHNITATATSPLGQVSEPTGIFNFEVDTKAPNSVENLQIYDNVGDKQGYILDGDTTDDATPTFSGKAEAGSTVTIYDNGNAIGSAKADSNGNWSFTPDSNLPDGEHIFTSSVTDKAGNVSTDNPSLTITIDTSGVEVSISALVDNVGDITDNITPNGVTDDTKPEITGEGKAGSTITIYDGSVKLGETTVKADGTWSFTPETALKEGSHSITVIAKDKAGNTSDRTSAFEFTVDTTAPTRPTIDWADDDVGSKKGELLTGSMTDDSTPTLHGTAEANSTVTIYDNKQYLGTAITDSEGKWSYTPSTPIEEGAHNFHVTATDKAGNVSTPSADFVLTTDYTAPNADALKITGVEDNFGLVTGNIEAGKVTDDQRPTIHGTGTAGDTIVVSVKDAQGERELGTAIVKDDGTWSLRPDTILNSGNNEFTAVEYDPVGNNVGPSNSYDINVSVTPPQPPTIVNIVDNEGPYTGPLQKGDVIDDNQPVITGTAVPNGKVTIYNNGKVLGTADVDNEGNWTFIPEPPLADGKYNITADATNTIGQVSNPTGIWNFEVDTTPPDAIKDLVILDNVGQVQDPLTDGMTTDDDTPTFSGTAESAGSLVTIYDDGVAIGSVVAGEGGKWSYTPSTPLDNGDYKFSTTVTDKAGNTGDHSPVVNITIDTTNVPVSLDKIVDDYGNEGNLPENISKGGVTNDTQPEFIGRGKPDSTISIFNGSEKLGETTVKADGSWTFTPSTPLPEGTYNIVVYQKDPAGNDADTGAAWQFTVDTTPPAKPTIEWAEDDVGDVTAPLYNNGATDDQTPTLHGKAEPGSIVKIYLDGNVYLGDAKMESDGSWSFTPTTQIPEGQHQFHVTATDAAGNVSEPSDNFNLEVDITPPDADALKITGVEDNYGSVTGNIEAGKDTDDQRPTIHGTGTAGDKIVVTVKDAQGERTLGTAIVKDDGTWSLRPETVLNSGNNEFTATEYDPVGNKVGPSNAYDVNVSVTPPQPPTIVNIVDNEGPYTGPLQKGDVIDDNQPVITGTAVANGKVTIYNNGKVLGTADVDSKGNWTFIPEPPLADGKYNITADATNTIGQVSSPTGIWNFEVDTTPPAAIDDLLILDNVGKVQDPLTDGMTTDDDTPTFSGTAESAGCLVTIYNDGVAIGSVVAGEDGKWSYTPSTPLDDGDYKFSTTVRDKAGNTGDHSPVVNITIDTKEVPVSLDKIVDDYGNEGNLPENISKGGVTNDTQPEFIGRGKPDSTISIFNGSEKLGETTVKADGSWSFTPSTPLPEGTYNIVVYQKDPAGNEDDTGTAWQFTVDTTPPAKPTIDWAEDDVGDVTDPLYNNGATDDQTPTLHGKAEPGSIVKVYVDGGYLGTAKMESDGNWTFTPSTQLPEGQHYFHVTATDAAGNTSLPSDNFNLEVDITPPDADALKITGVEDNFGSVTGNIESGKVTDDTRPTIHGTGTAGDKIVVTVKDALGERTLGTAIVQEDGTWSLRPEGVLSSGNNEFTATEYDPVGNKVGPSNAYEVTVSTTPPQQPTIERVVDNEGDGKTSFTGALQKGDLTDDSTPTIEGTAEPHTTVTIYNNGQEIGTAITDENGKWTFTPESALPDGKYNITADATNAIGQTSEKTGIWNFEIDTKAPDAVKNLEIIDNEGAVTGPLKNGDTTDDSTPTFNGTAESEGCLVIVYDDGKVIGSVVAGENGKWSYTPSSLPDGSYKFTTTVTDPAGNTSEHSPVVNIIIDTSKVEVKIEYLYDDQGTITGKIAEGGFTDDTRPDIHGTGKAGSTIVIYDGENELGRTTVKTDGTWTYTPGSDLGQGKHAISVEAIDKAGNTSDRTAAFEFSVDTVPPGRPTIDWADDDVGTVTDPLYHGSKTDDPTPTLHGTADKGSIVHVYMDNDTYLGTAKMDNTAGTWSFTPSSNLEEGSHTFYVIAKDTAGNESNRSTNFTLELDLTPPDITKLKITEVIDNVGVTIGDVGDGNFTDDSRPTIKGTGTAGDTIYVYVSYEGGKETLVGTATVDTNGNWSLRPDEAHALLEGNNVLTAKERDPVGNEVGPNGSYTIILDGTPITPPVLERVLDDVGTVTADLKSGDSTDDTQPVFEGKAAANSIVKMYDGTTLLGSAKADASGNWSLTPDQPMKNGESYNLTFTATSTIGQVSEPTSPAFVLNIDTTAPAPVENLLITDNVGDYQGPLKNGDTTDDATPTFEGKAEPGSVVTIYNDGVAIGSAKVGDNGTWAFTPETDLPDGKYKFTTTVTDKAGNMGDATPVVNITIDTSTLSVKIDKLIDDVGAVTGDIQANGFTDDLRPEIVGTVSKPGSTVTVYIDGVDQGTATVDADGNWSYTPTTDLGQGEHKVTVIAKDPSGNVTDMSPEFIFTIDNIPPALPTIEKAVDNVGDITGDMKSGAFTDDSTPTLEGTAEKGSTVTVYDKNTGLPIGSVVANDQGQWSYELPEQADGRHDYYVIASDKAGNTSQPTPDFTLNIDTQGPVGDNLKLLHVIDNVGNITGELTSGSGTDDSRPELKGTANEVGNTIIIYATDESGVTREVGRTTVDVNREWSHELVNALADGSYKLKVVEMDAAGNKTAPTPDFELLIDTTIPTAIATINNMTDDVGPITGNLPTDSYTDDSTPRLNGSIAGTLGANDKVTIYEKATNGVLTEIGTATMLDSNRWQFDIPPGTLVGGNKHTYVAAVTNKVGTSSTPSSDFVMTSVVEINSDTTLDTTPVISGRIPYALESGS